MTNRYGTLDVSVSNTKNDRRKLNRTLQISTQKDDQSQSQADNNDQKVNKFKQLYFKNEKLRKELKLLNEKLNQKLQKLKLPSVKKKAMSVDLNQSPPNPPSKALTRQLQNGYKQIAMYKKQVETLKGKEDTSQNYDKLRNTENMIAYMDHEINQVQQQLKSIKNVKKLQQKVMQQDIENAELKQKMADYQRQLKNFKDKLREIDKKKRKRQQEFKKQQAYLVALQQKIRKFRAEELQLQKPQPQKPREVSQLEFRQVKQELKRQKQKYQQGIKKTEITRIQVKNIKQNKNLTNQQIKQKENILRQLHIQVQTLSRLLKDLQIKRYQLTAVRDQDKKFIQSANKILKLQQIQDQAQSKKDQQSQLSKSQPAIMLTQTNKASTVTVKDNKDQRQWKGKMRKISKGYSFPTDTMFQQSGIILGLKVYFDQNHYICGLCIILLVNQTRLQSKIYGNSSQSQMKWQVQPGEYINRIYGGFTQQGYLSSIGLSTWTGQGNHFGNQEKDSFQFTLEYGQFFSGFFGGFRRLGQDVRVTQIGFWISRQ